jgi:geranylgeranyl reductase family protein
MSLETSDVVVVGAGPAGTIAAYELAKQGVRVVLFEKEKLPRYKACGGIVSPRAERVLDFSIAPVIERRVTKILITVRQRAPFIREYPRPIIYTVMRDTFDSFLVEKAKEAGAIVFDQSPVIGLTEARKEYVVTTAKKKMVTRYIVAADGANSTMRMLVDAPPFQRLSVAIEREVLDTENKLERWNGMVALDFGHLRSGYAWIFPKGQNFSIGVGGPKSLAKEFQPYYDQFTKYYKNQLSNAKPYISKGHLLPIRLLDERIVYGRTLLVGDAAGLIDPMIGEGIYFAMISAQLAAKTVIKAIQEGHTDLLSYQNEVDKEIQSEIQIAKILLKILDLAPGVWIPLLLKHSDTFWNYFCRVLIGEKNYRDIERKFGLLAKSVLALMKES